MRGTASNVGELAVKEAINWEAVRLRTRKQRRLEKEKKQKRRRNRKNKMMMRVENSSTGSVQTRTAAHIKLSESLTRTTRDRCRPTR